MAHLFVIENNIAKPNVETLLISPFKEIWDRDTSKDKSIAIKEFTYIELITSKKKSNPFVGYSDSIRGSKIIESIQLPKGWSPDALVLGAIDKIEEFNTNASPNYLAYKDSMEALNTTRKFLKEIDLSERNRSGMPVYKPVDIYGAIEKVEKAIISLNSLKERVEQEMFDAVKTKGNKSINPLEN